MSLTGRVWNFIKRHRRKFLFTGAVVGGLVLLNRYAQRKLREWEESETSKCFDRLKHEQHFESTQKTCRVTAMGLVSKLQERIVRASDCEALTEVLKSSPGNKVELWDELKYLAFERIVATVYGCSLLVTLLNVQLSILGGYMYLDAVGPLRTPPKASADLQQRYLSIIQQHFLSTGCQKVIERIRQAVNACLHDVSLSEKLSICKVQDLFAEIRRRLEDDSGLGRLSELVLPPEDDELSAVAVSSSKDDQDFADVVNETRDLFASDECQSVLTSTIAIASSFVFDVLSGCFSRESRQSDNPNELMATIQTAKLIPIVSQLSISLLSGHDSPLLTHLFQSTEQKTLAANIYEAFSQEQTLFRNNHKFC